MAGFDWEDVASVAGGPTVAMGIRIKNEKKLKRLQNETKEALEYVDRVCNTLENAIEELGKQRLETGAGILRDIYFLYTMIKEPALSDILSTKKEEATVFDDKLKKIEVITQRASNDIKNHSKDIRLSWGLDGKSVTTFIMSETINGPDRNNWSVKDIMLGKGRFKNLAWENLNIKSISMKRSLKEQLEIAESDLLEAEKIQKGVAEQEANVQKIEEGVKKLISLIKDEEHFLIGEKGKMTELLKAHLNWKEFSVQEKEVIGYIVYHLLRLGRLIEEPLLTEEGILTKRVVRMMELW